MKIKTSQSSCSLRSWLDQSLEKGTIDARVFVKSDETERLELKFDRRIASIWQNSPTSSPVTDLQPDGQPDGWAQSSNIWSFDPSSLIAAAAAAAVDVNQTSLLNHAADSLFVRPLSSAVPVKWAASTHPQPAFERTISRTESLLTSAATHFQPIRQDFYERAGNIVTDASVCGLVPCSGKCPNHIRNRADNKKNDESHRPASASLNELALFVGPFAGDEQERPLVSVGSADKSTNTSDDGLEEEDLLTQTPVIVDDYDAICSILNEVLSRRDEDEEQLHDEETIRTSPSTKRTPVSVFESLFVDPEASGYMYSQTDLLSQLTSHSDRSDGHSRRLFHPLHRQDESERVNEKRFVHQSVARTGRRSSRSPAPLVRHYVIEPKIERIAEYQKPCSFFLEGNCRKVDCKFSHDLSRIVCKFWMEGFCFKGEHCPFRHSAGHAVRDENLNQPVDLTSFAIESENDFPSLALEEKKAVPGTKKVVPLGQRKGEPVNGQSDGKKTKQMATKRSSPQVLFRSQVGKGRKKKKSQQKGV